MTHIATVTVLGTGVLGAQIAYQAAYSGFDVVAYDINETALAAARKRFVKLAATYEEQVKGTAGGKADAALKRITLQMDLGRAVAAANLVIEAVPENLELKREIYRKIGRAQERTSKVRPQLASDAVSRRCSRAAGGRCRRSGDNGQDVANCDPFVAGSVPNPPHGRLAHRLQHRRGNEKRQRLARYLKENYIDKGKLGAESDKGFYRYPSS